MALTSCSKHMDSEYYQDVFIEKQISVTNFN